MARQLLIPSLGENIESVVVAKLLVRAGDTVKGDQALLELESDKAVLEVPAEEAGTLVQLLVSEGDTVTIGQPFAELAPSAGASEAPATESSRDATPPPAASGPSEPSPADIEESLTPTTLPLPVAAPGPARRQPHVPAAPSVRRFAREIGIDIDTVKGSGPHGRVSMDDVKRTARERHSAGTAGPVGILQPPLPDFSQWGSVRRERMSAIRAATAQHVSVCWNSVPRVTHFDRADITKLDALRRQYADRATAAGGKLTMAVMVTKVAAVALRKFPKFNASVDMTSREVIYKDYVHVGIAVATERGLLVPVIRDADRKNMVELAVTIGELAKTCRSGKITPAEMEGGTFTVTNVGSIGGTYFTPIVNVPQVAILGMGRATEELVLNNGEIETRTILPLSLSYDHRLIDGADAARFVRWIADAIEEPLLLSLEGAS